MGSERVTGDLLAAFLSPLSCFSCLLTLYRLIFTLAKDELVLPARGGRGVGGGSGGGPVLVLSAALSQCRLSWF